MKIDLDKDRRSSSQLKIFAYQVLQGEKEIPDFQILDLAENCERNGFNGLAAGLRGKYEAVKSSLERRTRSMVELIGDGLVVGSVVIYHNYCGKDIEATVYGIGEDTVFIKHTIPPRRAYGVTPTRVKLVK